MMPDNKKSLQFTWADVEQWVENGLIAPDQAREIRRYFEAAGPVAEQTGAGPEQREGLNLVTIAYYSGGLLILLAYISLIGLQWASLGYVVQTAVLLLTIGILWAVGCVVKRAGFSLGGNLLVFAGVGIVPLLIYSVLRMVGFWPADPHYPYPDDYHASLAIAWMVVDVVGAYVAAVVLWRVRFPLLTLLVAFWSWRLSMDLVGWIAARPTWMWASSQQIVSSLMGVAMLALGIYLQRRTRRDFSLWFYVFGHVLVLTNLSFLLLDEGVVQGLAYLMIYLVFIVASVWLQRRSFLAFGAIGCYVYLGFLAFDVFAGSLGFAFALAVIGFFIILTTIGYQKHAQPWLARYFESHAQPRRLDS